MPQEDLKCSRFSEDLWLYPAQEGPGAPAGSYSHRPMVLLEIRDLQKSYVMPGAAASPPGAGATDPLQRVLDVPAFDLAAGREVALAGGSGSGKTTLLHLIAGLLTPDGGSISIDGTDITQLSEARRDAFRSDHLGYVFQSFHLLEGYTALENVLLGMLFGPGQRGSIRERRARAGQLLARLGMADRAQHRPSTLSIGQKQRVAVARALANRPRLVLADEPTGSLDRRRAEEALGLMREVCREEGAALLLVSHDPAVLETFERVERLEDLNRAATPSGGLR